MNSCVANINEDDPRKRKAFTDHTLTTGHDHHDHDHEEVNNNNNNGCSGSSSLCCPCIHCHCGCHNNAVRTTTATVDDPAYLDSLPTGYRFNPTDKELIKDYLVRKIMNMNLPKNKINEADIYGVNHPKDIVAGNKYLQAVEGEWYFFTPRDRKYPNGKRPRRTAGGGYWKATGPDTVINYKGTKIGGKKSLVYHEGNPPKGIKTDWMMHEYVAEGYERQRIDANDMKLDDYVLCRIYVNKKHGKKLADEVDKEQHCAGAPSDQVVTGQSHPSNQDSSLGSFQADNNNVNMAADQHYSDQYNIMPIMGSNHQHMINSSSSVRNEIHPNMFPNHQQQAPHPTILQVENNVVVQNYQDMSGSLYGLMASSNVWPGVQMNHPSRKRFNQKYTMSNPPHFPTTPGHSPPLPLRINVNTPDPPHGHGNNNNNTGMYWSSTGLNSNPQTPHTPPPLTAFQEGTHCVAINKNMELMYTQEDIINDGQLLHDNHGLQLVFVGQEQ